MVSCKTLYEALQLDSFRYRFYREHKYVSFCFSELEILIAKTNFNDPAQTQLVKQQLESLICLMQAHASFENSMIHALFRQKGVDVQWSIEADHVEHEKAYQDLHDFLLEIIRKSPSKQRLAMGHAFYLKFRWLVGDNLRHLHEEETVLMPALQKLYTDDELRLVEFNTFTKMTIQQMQEMLDVVSPYLNDSDREFFINEMKTHSPDFEVSLAL